MSNASQKSKYEGMSDKEINEHLEQQMKMKNIDKQSVDVML